MKNKNNVEVSMPISIFEYPYPMCELSQSDNHVEVWDVATAEAIIKSLQGFIDASKTERVKKSKK